MFDARTCVHRASPRLPCALDKLGNSSSAGWNVGAWTHGQTNHEGGAITPAFSPICCGCASNSKTPKPGFERSISRSRERRRSSTAAASFSRTMDAKPRTPPPINLDFPLSGLFDRVYSGSSLTGAPVPARGPGRRPAIGVDCSRHVCLLVATQEWPLKLATECTNSEAPGPRCCN